MALPVVAALALALRPLRFGLSVALIWLIVGMFDDTGYRWVFRDRGFFGPVKVRIVDKDEARTGFEYKTLIHGGIDHGRQHIKESKRHEPCAYFHPLTGIGQVFMKLSWPNTPVPASLEEFFQKSNPYNVFTLPNQRFPAALAGVGNDPFSALVALHSEPPYAVIGLGTGTLAAFAKPYQSVDIYEIDPLVYRLSQKVDDEEPPFTYLEDAKKRGANLRVILGDGRLKIKDAPDNWYHIIVLDAFSSDAIPVHLLTVDAIETYLKKLAPGGVLVFNTTNRYVKLNGVLKDIADELDLECLKLGNWHTQVIPELYGTDFLAMRRNPRAIEKLNLSFSGGPPLSKRLDLERYNSLMKNIRLFQKEHRDFFRNENWSWQQWRAPKNFGGRLWTDRYSNLLSVLQIGEGKSPVVSDEGEVLSDD
jgi:SAM-dependent methyltransferase